MRHFYNNVTKLVWPFWASCIASLIGQNNQTVRQLKLAKKVAELFYKFERGKNTKLFGKFEWPPNRQTLGHV